jgi:hypothetical protein
MDVFPTVGKQKTGIFPPVFQPSSPKVFKKAEKLEGKKQKKN